MEYIDFTKKKRNFIVAVFIGLILALVISGYIAYSNKLYSVNGTDNSEIQEILDY